MTINDPHPIDLHVGNRLRLRRTMLGMSQEELGASVGVTFQQIQKYERGLNRIGSSRLYEFTKILKVKISYFFEEMDKISTCIENKVAEDNVNFEYEDNLNKEVLGLIKAFCDIKDSNVRKRVVMLLKSMAKSQNISADLEEDLEEEIDNTI